MNNRAAFEIGSGNIEIDQAEFEGLATNYFISEARKKVVRDYEKNPDPDSNLAYHNADHMDDCLAIVNAIFAKCHFGKNDFHLHNLAKIAVAMHDYVVQWREHIEIDEQKNVTVTRDYRPIKDEPSSEQLSANSAKALMTNFNIENGTMFSQADISLICDAILATETVLQNGRIIHPNITAESSILARISVLSDVGRAGFHSGSFLHDGNKLFIEQNIDITRRVREQGELPLDKDEQKMFAWRILEWDNRQIQFAEHLRDVEFPLICSGLDNEILKQLSEIFAQLDVSIAQARSRYSLNSVMYKSGEYAEIIEEIYI